MTWSSQSTIPNARFLQYQKSSIIYSNFQCKTIPLIKGIISDAFYSSKLSSFSVNKYLFSSTKGVLSVVRRQLRGARRIRNDTRRLDAAAATRSFPFWWGCSFFLLPMFWCHIIEAKTLGNLMEEGNHHHHHLRQTMNFYYTTQWIIRTKYVSMRRIRYS